MTAPAPHTLRTSSRAGSAPAVALPAAGAPYLGGRLMGAGTDAAATPSAGYRGPAVKTSDRAGGSASVFMQTADRSKQRPGRARARATAQAIPLPASGLLLLAALAALWRVRR
jgi:hypothetical protein